MAWKSIKDLVVGEQVSGYARIINKRIFGALVFCLVRFNEETVQLVLTKKETHNYGNIKRISNGSMIFLHGYKNITKKGECSIFVTQLEECVQCLESFPEKYHGLNQANRYRNRTVDLVSNSASFDIFKTIAELTSAMKIFLYSQGFKEFSTGVFQENFEGGNARSFSAFCNANAKKYHLSMTSELKLKRLLVAGFEKVFEVTQSFRNEGIDAFHSPEFTLLEAYKLGSSCSEVMDLTERMIKQAVKSCSVNESCVFVDQDKQVIKTSFTQDFKRISFNEAVYSFLGIQSGLNIDELVSKFPDSFSVDMDRFTWVMKLIEKFIAPNIINPTFLTDIPSGLSPFIKTSKNNPEIAERAFFIAHKLSIADIYTDENDYNIVWSKLTRQDNGEVKKSDQNFLDVLAYGLPQTAGIGMCLNRFFMLFLGSLPRNIKETILFPIM